MRCRFDGDWTQIAIGACIEVHRELGPGLLESAYQECLAHELRLRGVAFEQQKPVALRYKGVDVEVGYRIDFVIEASLLLELKAVERFAAVHEAQLLTYLRLTG